MIIDAAAPTGPIAEPVQKIDSMVAAPARGRDGGFDSQGYDYDAQNSGGALHGVDSKNGSTAVASTNYLCQSDGGGRKSCWIPKTARVTLQPLLMKAAYFIARQLVCGLLLFSAGCFPWHAPEKMPEHGSLASARSDSADAIFLNLHQQGLGEIPPGIESLGNLRKLSLRGNPLKSLPSSIGEFSQLQWLDLAETGLTALPSEIEALKSLRTLYLSDNPIKVLHPSIGGLSALHYLNLDRNRLASLPVEIGKLSELRWLRLNANQLSTVADEVGQLSNLKRLYLRSNKLQDLPKGLVQLDALTDLSLSNNQFERLPGVVTQLKHLERLDLDGNKLTTLPENLGHLVDLKWLKLERNKLTDEEKTRIREALPNCHVSF